MNRWRYVLAGVVAVMAAGAVLAAPYTPPRDDVVLEQLPEKGDPSLASLKRMRAALAAKPGDLGIAVAVARKALEAARELGDPRFLGQAQAALAPWWTGDDVSAAAMLLRATLKQSQHDFEGSLKDLDRLLVAQPASAQARLTRATVLGVEGRYAEARRDCAALSGRVQPLVFLGCDAVPASLSGGAADAYAALVAELDTGRASPEMREWALTLAAEIAARRGDFAAAERHFRDALVLDPRDAYLKGAYADFLIDRGRPHDVLPLLRGDAANDGLLLRLALAERRLPAARDAFIAHSNELAARFDAAQRRGDSLHRREEARFRLDIGHDATSSLALARANWAVQREPADLRILVDAARAANDAATLDLAAQWMATTRVDDVAVASSLEVRR
jgi:predicted Zn-dependent protease